MDPEFAAAFAADPFSHLHKGPPEGISFPEYAQQTQMMVAVLAQHYEKKLPEESQYTVAHKTVGVADGQITVRIITPTSGGSGATYPVLVWLHGGGWQVGDVDMDDYHLRTIAVELNIVIINVDYRLAPTNPFPIPFDDSYAAVKWVAEHAADLKVSLDKGYLVGGDSSGGNLAAAVSLQARDDPFFAGKPITGQYLREPIVVHPFAVPEKFKSEWRSFEENKDAVTLPSAAIIRAMDGYGAPSTDPRFAPLVASSHANLPPAFIQVMGMDALRDDGVVYDKALREAGVPTRLIIHPGVLHGFYYTFPAISPAVQVDREAREGLRWLLGFTKAA
ncbi:Alpha/Beta hydrolase protein [Ganoderma leucocontextum]|nr:Alpha/Beta hydrolase protein [Ganoderma leucocontextum]